MRGEHGGGFVVDWRDFQEYRQDTVVVNMLTTYVTTFLYSFLSESRHGIIMNLDESLLTKLRVLGVSPRRSCRPSRRELL